MVGPKLREEERIDRLEKELKSKSRPNKKEKKWYNYWKLNKNRFINQDDADFASAFDWGNQ